MQSVILEPLATNKYRSITYEPQFVQIRPSNSAFVYLDAQASTLETNKVNMLLSSIQRLGDFPSNLTTSICRLTVSSAAAFYCTPNVNVRNNNIIFYSSISGIEHSVIIPEGFYTTSSALMDAIVAAMNTVSGASGITFIKTAVFGNPDMWNLNASVGVFYISPLCNAVTKGLQLYNFPISTALVTSTKIGTMALFYTRYIDFTSNRLNAYSKYQSLSNNGTINIMFRLFIDDPTNPHWIAGSPTIPSSHSFEPSDSLTTIDFQLKDQFGDLLHIPDGPVGTNSGFTWDLNLNVQI
ncbi:MAG: hypothetical protein EPO58_17405 [Chitinophagaceae bacterium]|nr:MAG: hypothetical protein EPO58_17405 [Chitinophagaceae bacterium]